MMNEKFPVKKTDSEIRGQKACKLGGHISLNPLLSSILKNLILVLLFSFKKSENKENLLRSPLKHFG